MFQDVTYCQRDSFTFKTVAKLFVGELVKDKNMQKRNYYKFRGYHGLQVLSELLLITVMLNENARWQ